MTKAGESMSIQVMPVLLGLITDSVLDSITELGLSERAVIITAMGIIYAGFYVYRKAKKRSNYEQKKLKVSKDTSTAKGVISRRVTTVLIVGLVIAIVLVGFGSAILGLTIGEIVRLMAWLVVMGVFVLSGNFLSGANMIFLLRGIAAVGLGGALSMGGVPTVEFFAAEPVELTIQNYCSDPIEYDLLGIEVPGNTTKTIRELEPLTVTFTRDGNYVYVYALCRTRGYHVPEDAFVSFNGQVIKPGESLTVDLREQEQHELFIQCSES